ncbi:hypothetical protein [Thiolapillus sp.]|uniref:hypothetical protein n=1 Tax=Thiolapillus sp. TaxID=2017437 RepID=UPI003AF6C41B
MDVLSSQGVDEPAECSSEVKLVNRCRDWIKDIRHNPDNVSDYGYGFSAFALPPEVLRETVDVFTQLLGELRELAKVLMVK